MHATTSQLTLKKYIDSEYTHYLSGSPVRHPILTQDITSIKSAQRKYPIALQSSFSLSDDDDD